MTSSLFHQKTQFFFPSKFKGIEVKFNEGIELNEWN
jgi:hypothetical protein